MKKRLSERKTTIRQLIREIDVVGEAMMGLPFITMTGNNSVSVENFLSIAEVGPESFRLKTKSGEIIVLGNDLIARSMTKEEIVIKGKIKGISFN
ncbi:MAG: hypothetical protein BEN19_03935 [Epulopiscium sp. Nuni2H_MBin003]|nr:MAG: hypothetical protein BEN19_03935 [Epulopiscium sp. Nuni2H_MBin003]